MWSLGRQAVLLGYDHRFFVMATIATMEGSAYCILLRFLHYLVFRVALIFHSHSIIACRGY